MRWSPHEIVGEFSREKSEAHATAVTAHAAEGGTGIRPQPLLPTLTARWPVTAHLTAQLPTPQPLLPSGPPQDERGWLTLTELLLPTHLRADGRSPHI